ncbi:PPE family protein [Mycobacterium intracellulare]|uniref:PPE family protein n=1 Tax=Mycobacterium intracellulare TaxID=1767 RepID=A0AAE4RIH1_MYCIT|nr:PPE family protein [Mycobacterium intracellulare]MCA2319761.1 PPE family protein [Mycobacterium intracellulare]MCA2340303.1 PPE family protein [Mycobacterium intracellulare]MDV6978595.1 PPE family protein [Mycobacterium intracellulare]MDV6983870.1 PPE family protein [Mycobacterium intracellulare]MDV7013552.1 PPE family protein [Mycobacterium intracellulare]
MDLLAPPEVTSTLIHTGPGAGSLIEAAGAWQRLAVELENSVSTYASTLSSLIDSWDGPSAMAMLQSVQPYLLWLRETAQQSAQMATSAEAAASAFSATRATVVHPSVVTANRTRLRQLLMTNRFGTNTAAIAEAENEYQSMWANNAAAMTRYQATTSQATTQLSPFTSPLPDTNPAGTANQQAAVMKAANDSVGSQGSNFLNSLTSFDPNSGWFAWANTWGNQFISSGFPINLLGVWAQLATAQGVASVGGDIGSGLSEGLGATTASLANAIKGIGAGASAPTGALGVGVSLGKLTAPPAVVGLLPGTPTGVQLASAASPLPAAESGFPMMPMMVPPPTASAGTGWRKRKQQKYEDVAVGREVKGKVMPRNPSAG